MLTWIRTLGRGLLDVIYPPRCLGCGGRPESVRLPVCPRCLQSLERAPVMGVAARLDRLAVGRGALDGATALWVFDKGGTLQAVQHALKYGDRPRYGVALGELVGQGHAGTKGGPTGRVDGVVPIPLHRTRELERGYNQAAMIARGVAGALNCPLRTDLLTRPRPTRSQTHLSRRERWQNVRDAFDASPDAEGGSWLLVDDVLTTGSTATAAARVLKDAGARTVTLTVLAMART
jgi:ComF family protein